MPHSKYPINYLATYHYINFTIGEKNPDGELHHRGFCQLTSIYSCSSAVITAVSVVE
jgi:hypothetical protein